MHMIPSRLATIALFVAPLLGARAQSVTLARPAAEFAEPFSFIRGLRELPDGRVLVADYLEDRVALVDLARGSSTDVLTEGAGPRNVRLPMAIVALGDSSLVVDYGNSRVVVLGPDARPARASVMERSGRLFMRGLTRDGAWLYAVPSWAEGPNALPDDSVRVVKWRPGASREEPVFVLQGTRFRKDRSPSMQPRIPTVGYAGQDAWAVTDDGSMWVVRHAPFRVERMTGDGRWQRGPIMPTQARRVTAADKRRFVTEFSAASPTSGRGADGGMGRAPLPDAAEIARLTETTEWAEFHPSFDATGVFVAPRGQLWVRRTTEPGHASVYDVFDANGNRLRDVTLPVGQRVLAVTARGVYALRENDDGEQYLLRYPPP